MDVASMSEGDDNVSICEESTEILRLIDYYCWLYANRFVKRRIAINVFMNFVTIANQYGFGDRAGAILEHCVARARDARKSKKFINSNDVSVMEATCRSKSIYGERPLPNALLALNELDRLEGCLGSLFVSNKVLLPAILPNPVVHGTLRHYQFSNRIWRLRDAILNEDWGEAGRMIGRIPYFRSSIFAGIAALKNLDYAFINRYRMMPYVVSLFRAGVQRFLQHNIPRDLVTKSAAEHMLVLIDGSLKESCAKGRNLNLVFITELLVFTIANGLDEDRRDLVNCVTSLPRNSHVPEFAVIMRGYKALAEYESWRLAGCRESPNESLALVDNLIAAINDVPSGEETVFLDALVHLLSVLQLNDTVVDVVTDCCQKSPFMFGHCFWLLTQHHLNDEAQQLISTVMSSSTKLSASDPVWLEWVQQRLLNPFDYDLSPEILLEMCRLLFGFLDYGENRINERAWVFLFTCVQRIQRPEALAELWAPRRDWWPKFHTAPMGDTAIQSRRQVLDIMRSLPESFT